MNGSGVYEILHVESGKRYIGSARDFQKRWNAHRSHLRRGSHHSPHLQRSWLKHGEAGFEFRILEPCDPSHVILFEQVWLDWCKPEFNVCPKAYSTAGRKFTEATKEKIRQSSIGKKMPARTAEYREKISKAHKGKQKSSEHMKALQAGREKHIPTKAQREAISNSLKLAYQEGRKSREKTQEHCHKIGKFYAKLSDQEIREIRKLRADGVTGRELAKRYNSNPGTISNIVNGKRYCWVV